LESLVSIPVSTSKLPSFTLSQRSQSQQHITSQHSTVQHSTAQNSALKHASSSTLSGLGDGGNQCQRFFFFTAVRSCCIDSRWSSELASLQLPETLDLRVVLPEKHGKRDQAQLARCCIAELDKSLPPTWSSFGHEATRQLCEGCALLGHA